MNFEYLKKRINLNTKSFVFKVYIHNSDIYFYTNEHKNKMRECQLILSL